MYILGINAYHADASVALLKDGELLVALEEERFRRVKHWAGFPSLAVTKALEFAGISGEDVSHVALARDPRAHMGRKLRFALTHPRSAALVAGRLRFQGKVADVRVPLARSLGLTPADLPTIHAVEHHPAHLASTFFVSPFEEAAVASADGLGDFVSTAVGMGSGSRIDVLDRVYFPHSLGYLYQAITQFLGFGNYGDEFKVMGLAPYGTPRFTRELRELVELRPEGDFRLNLDYFRHWRVTVSRQWQEGYPETDVLYSERLAELLSMPARDPAEDVTAVHDDLAASLQAVFEEALFHVLNDLHQRTGSERVCLSGGCAMNSVANGKVRDRTPFREVFIQPASGDNGVSLGAAFHVWNQVLGQARSFRQEHSYWGLSYPDASFNRLLGERDLGSRGFEVEAIHEERELCGRVATLLADGLVVGWFQGRFEWGARALGNRSILADPRRADMRELINTKIKFRERFRPFAPSVAEEALSRYFDGAVPDPFMLTVHPVRDEMRGVIPAVTHVDGSGRIQTVSEATNPRYYRLIREFEALTGVPVLLNTSFNENEPIVDTPEQALECFLRTRMDVLVVGNVIVRRPPGELDPPPSGG